MNAPPGVFLSHHRGTHSAAVAQLCERLREAGLRPITDEQVLAGHGLTSHLRRLIDDADLVVVLLSEGGLRSSWVEDELTHVQSTTKPRIPVIDGDLTEPMRRHPATSPWWDDRDRLDVKCLTTLDLDAIVDEAWKHLYQRLEASPPETVQIRCTLRAPGASAPTPPTGAAGLVLDFGCAAATPFLAGNPGTTMVDAPHWAAWRDSARARVDAVVRRIPRAPISLDLRCQLAIGMAMGSATHQRPNPKLVWTPASAGGWTPVGPNTNAPVDVVVDGPPAGTKAAVAGLFVWFKFGAQAQDQRAAATHHLTVATALAPYEHVRGSLDEGEDLGPWANGLVLALRERNGGPFEHLHVVLLGPMPAAFALGQALSHHHAAHLTLHEWAGGRYVPVPIRP